MSKIYTVIGLMSGTSLDGVDAAVLRTDGERFVEAGGRYFRPYTTEERNLLSETMRDALAWNFTGPPPNSFARAEVMIDRAHKDAVTALIQQDGLHRRDVNYLGYHGQTVLHRAPGAEKKGQTLQIGSGQALADATGIGCVFDFRTNDVALGGQGAPLAPIYHKALMDAAGLERTAVVNIGGVSNLTVDTAGGLIASDCGPGNGPLDSWMSRHGLGDYDDGGRLSLSGTPDIARLTGWMQSDFFRQSVPKSADRYDFDVLNSIHDLSSADGAATLSMFCAMGIADTLNKCAQGIERLVVCGGGRFNAAIMAGLVELTQTQVISANDIGWDGDALEAQAFAYMAVRHIKGLPLSFPGTTGIKNAATGGVFVKPTER